MLSTAMHHHPSAFLLALLPALCPLGRAQTAPGLLGLTRTTPVLLWQDPAACTTQRCLPAMPNAAGVPAFAGGTAWDPTRSAVWVTNGKQLGLFAAATCTTLCPPFALPMPDPATGLAFLRSRGLLLVSDAQNRLTVCKPACGTLTVQNQCQAFSPGANQFVIGGLAVSEVRDLVFYAASNWLPTVPPGPTLFVAKPATPCQYFCKIAIPACATASLGPISGAAYDECGDLVWVTDGQVAVALRCNLTTCTAQVAACCRLPTVAEPWIGLCMQPSPPLSSGQSCTAPACPSCPALRHGLLGDPVLGNPSFALQLAGAPANAQAFVVLNIGRCGGGLTLPPFCGPLLVPLQPSPLLLGGFPTGGSIACTGTAVAGLPIPPNPAFCGAVLSSQYLALCPAAAGFGTAVSNCLSWTIE